MRSLRVTVLALATFALAAGCKEDTQFRLTPTTGTTAAAATEQKPERPQAVHGVSPVATWSTATRIPTYGTRKCWPIVFVHGMGGFGFQIGSTTYWNGVPDELQSNGFEAMFAVTHAFDTVEMRARELEKQIDALYPDPRVKVNIIAHSMGGLDARYLVSTLKRGGKVASITTVATPHRGSPAADVIFKLIQGPIADTTEAIMKTFGQDVVGGGTELTTTFLKETFNPENPDDPRVSYFSWAGLASPVSTPSHGPLIPFLIPTWALVLSEGENDGLVSLSSAKWGQFQGTVPADHWREVGLPSPDAAFDSKAFYLARALELESRGFGPPRH